MDLLVVLGEDVMPVRQWLPIGSDDAPATDLRAGDVLVQRHARSGIDREARVMPLDTAPSQSARNPVIQDVNQNSIVGERHESRFDEGSFGTIRATVVAGQRYSVTPKVF